MHKWPAQCEAVKGEANVVRYVRAERARQLKTTGTVPYCYLACM